jgi:hypothetical protein
VSELPVPTVAPKEFTTDEVLTGFVVDQEKLIVQLFAPELMTHEGVFGVRTPVIFILFAMEVTVKLLLVAALSVVLLFKKYLNW